jgi:hypothetical protein
VALLAVTLTGTAALAQEGVFRAAIDDRDVSESTETRPITLVPAEPSVIAVDVTNSTSSAVLIKTVRIEGKVIGLTFFAYDTSVGMNLDPGASGSRRFALDLGGLDGQATGLIPGSVKLLDGDRRVVAEERAVFDVRGSLRSVYGLFGMGVAFITLVSFLASLIALARHRLPANRWRRALRFLTPGLGLGLVVNFTLSATRVFVPGLGRWLTIMVVTGLVFFGVGYLTPTPPDEDEDEEDDNHPLLVATSVKGLAGPAERRLALATENGLIGTSKQVTPPPPEVATADPDPGLREPAPQTRVIPPVAGNSDA